ncbi:MAG: hypothetical protein JWR54_2835 [Mucilaginibacter sp.]|nr:hypothetical protein [Mucilaginibacter sp.]
MIYRLLLATATATHKNPANFFHDNCNLHKNHVVIACKYTGNGGLKTKNINNKIKYHG